MLNAGGSIVSQGIAIEAGGEAAQGQERKADSFGLTEQEDEAFGFGGLILRERCEGLLRTDERCRAGWRAGGSGGRDGSSCEVVIERGDDAAFGFPGFNGPEGDGKHRLNESAAEGYETRFQSFSEGKRPGGEDEKGNESDCAEVTGFGSEDYHHADCECPDYGGDDG